MHSDVFWKHTTGTGVSPSMFTLTPSPCLDCHADLFCICCLREYELRFNGSAPRLASKVVILEATKDFCVHAPWSTFEAKHTAMTDEGGQKNNLLLLLHAVFAGVCFFLNTGVALAWFL